jgi:hypothetical protein
MIEIKILFRRRWVRTTCFFVFSDMSLKGGQPAGPPVTEIAFNPPFLRSQSADKEQAGIFPPVVKVSSISNKTPWRFWSRSGEIVSIGAKVSCMAENGV